MVWRIYFSPDDLDRIQLRPTLGPLAETVLAVGLLRETRRRPATGAFVSISGADPLNLVGILTPGPRVPAVSGHSVLFRDGAPVVALRTLA